MGSVSASDARQRLLRVAVQRQQRWGASGGPGLLDGLQAQAYYNQAENKRQSIKEILEIDDLDTFLDSSGYAEKLER